MFCIIYAPSGYLSLLKHISYKRKVYGFFLFSPMFSVYLHGDVHGFFLFTIKDYNFKNEAQGGASNLLCMHPYFPAISLVLALLATACN